MSGWNFEKSSKGNGKETKYTKFAVGITKIRLLNEAPESKWIHWMPKFNKAITCPGKGCPICEIRRQQKTNGQTPTYNMSRRLIMNVLNLDTNQVEVMEQGVTFYEDLRDLKEDIIAKGKELPDAILKVKRRGDSKDDTSYRIDVDAIAPLTKEEMDKHRESMVDLKEFTAPHEIDQILELLSGKAWEDVFKRDEVASVESNPSPNTEDEVVLK